MTLQTTNYDQLVKLFADWSPSAGLLSFAADEIKVRLAIGEDVRLTIKRTDMHFFYKIREQLQDCLTELSKEVETNLLTMSRDQHDIIYLGKLATTHNEIKVFLSKNYEKVLARFEGIAYDIEPPKKLAMHKFKDSRGLELTSFDEPIDPYWNEYVTEEQFIIKDETPILIRLITTIAEGFSIAADIIRRAITQSIVYKLHPELIQLAISVPADQQDTSTEIASFKDDKKLTAVQKLLFIRLLQIEELFPKKPANTDDAPELRAIALLTGISYENQIKGGSGANAKVNPLLDDRTRLKMTAEQAKPKLKDLDAVENVARLLNIHAVLSLIEKYRKELTQIITNR